MIFINDVRFKGEKLLDGLSGMNVGCGERGERDKEASYICLDNNTVKGKCND